MSGRHRVGFLVLVGAYLVARGEWSSAAPFVCFSCQPVAFEIVEGIPDKKSWDFDQAEPTTRFTAPAFALAGLPKKYSTKGVIDDRAAPFLVRGSAKLTIPQGKYRLLLRARGAARVWVDGEMVLETRFRVPSDNGHGAVPELPGVREPGLALLPAENQEQIAALELDGKPHDFLFEAIVGDQKLRPELGEISLSIASSDQTASESEPAFRLLATNPAIPLSQQGWANYKRSNFDWLAQIDSETRRLSAAAHDAYWHRRHEIARRYWQDQPAPAVPEVSDKKGELSPVDRFLLADRKTVGVGFSLLLDDFAFLRRVSLDTVGTIPKPSEITAFMNDASPNRRARDRPPARRSALG